MVKISSFRLLFSGLLFCISIQGLAWGVTGHRVIGEIADQHLSPNARARVRAILGNESIAIASNWADLIKSDSSYRYLNVWHYLDFDSAMTYTEVQDFLKKDTAVDAYTRLNLIIRQLKNKRLTQPQKQFYLRLLIHIVGDIHQPLHTCYDSDQGGNNVKVLWFSEATNLHSVWDSYLIDFQKLSFTEYAKAINFATPAQKKKLQTQPMNDWFYESFFLCEKIHREIKQPQQRLSFEYNFRNIGIVNDQLLKGGIRLAGLLNSIFAQ